MRNRGLLMLAMAVVFAVVAAFLAQDWLRGQVRPIQQVVSKEAPPPPKTTIVVAARPLFYGSELTRQNVREIPWLAEELPPGAFKKTDELFADKAPRIVLRTIETNEAILNSKISGDKHAATLSAVIEQRMRAITLRVNDVLGVAGFVIPGDRVDMLLTREAAGGRPETTLLLQNVQVLGIDQQASEDKNEPKVVRAVTVELTPYQAQKVVLGTQVGTISLALRNRGDVGVTRGTRVTLADLGVGEALQPATDAAISTPAASGGVAPAPAANGPTNKASIQVSRGLKVFKYSVEREQFDSGGSSPAASDGPIPLAPPSRSGAAGDDGAPDGGATPGSTSGAPGAGVDAGGSAGPGAAEAQPTSILPSDTVKF